MKATTFALSALTLIACGGRPEAPQGPRTPGWASAMGKTATGYAGLVEFDDRLVELSVTLAFEPPPPGNTTKSKIRMPLLLGYDGPEASETIKVTLETADGTEHDVWVEGDSTLPTPGKKRRLLLELPTVDAVTHLAFDVGVAEFAIEPQQSQWEARTDEASTRLVNLVAGRSAIQKLCEQLAGSPCTPFSNTPQVDASIALSASAWTVRYCPAENCYHRCKEARSGYEQLGGRGRRWMRADRSFCITGPASGEAVPDDAESMVAEFVDKALLSDG